MSVLVLTVGGCYTTCNAGWVACYAAAGLVAGAATGGAALPAAALTCNSIQGTCMTACTASAVTEGAVTGGSVAGPFGALAGSLLGAGIATGAYYFWTH